MRMTRSLRALVWVFALLGLAAASTSLFVHYRLLADPGYTSFCDISETVSCTDAYLSRYGSVAGVPVALSGVIAFAAILLLALVELRGPETVRPAVPTYLFLASAVGLAAVLYFAHAAFFVLEVVCLLCLGTYAAVTGLCVVSGLAASVAVTTVPRRLPGDIRAVLARPAFLALLLLYVAGSASAVAFFPTEASTRAAAAQAQPAPVPPDLRAQFERWWTAQPRVPLPVPASGAAVVIVKFTDMQCPLCGLSHFSMKPILAKYEQAHPGAVVLVEKDYPLQTDCNPALPRSIHTASCDAAAALRMARSRNRGGQLEDFFYGNQSTLTPATVREAAARIAGITDFDLGYARAIEGVKTDVALARILDIHQTPTFFINGVRCEIGGASGRPEPLKVEFMDLAIACELRKAGIGK